MYPLAHIEEIRKNIFQLVYSAEQYNLLLFGFVLYEELNFYTVAFSRTQNAMCND